MMEMKKLIGSARSTFSCSNAVLWARVTLLSEPFFLPPVFEGH